jgi:diguanylate cyclase (GGDEF)-like protein
MSSSRVYRKACDKDHIKHELTNGRGKQFDPDFTDVFLDLWEQGLLDEILSSDSNADNGGLEESSALLQEVMETFVSQSAVDDIDITTGIMTRTAGEAVMAQAMKLDDGCFVFFDVDNLKKINDTQGHDSGDKVLRLMGDTLTDNSSDGVCCRLGGDEFLLFIRKVSKEEAEDRVKTIIDDFESRKSTDPKLSVASLSAGMVMCTPSDTYMKVYSNADKALYHVKQNGKNNFGFYDSDSEAVRNEELDMKRLVNGIKTSGSYNGAMGVEYREFTKLYELVANMEKRFDCPFKLIVVTLETVSGDAPDINELEKAMFYMEQSIHQTIRGVDILTRYSSQQFLILLLGADDAGVKLAVDRIFRGYYKMNVSGAFSPSYAVADTKTDLTNTVNN